MKPEKVFYEPAVLNYELGRQLKDKFAGVEWIPVKNHNNIEQLRKNPNSEFTRMKRYLVIGVRKSLKYVPNNKFGFFRYKPLPDAAQCAFIATWFVIITSVHICGFSSTVSR